MVEEVDRKGNSCGARLGCDRVRLCVCVSFPAHPSFSFGDGDRNKIALYFVVPLAQEMAGTMWESLRMLSISPLHRKVVVLRERER